MSQVPLPSRPNEVPATSPATVPLPSVGASFYRKGYGELDTTFNSRFNEGLVTGGDHNYTRSRNQKWYDLLGSALLNTGAEIGLGAAEGAGYLADIPQWKNIVAGTEQEFGNWFSDMMKEWKQNVKTNVAPIYTTPEDSGFHPLNPYWWADNAPSIGSAISLLIPSYGATKLLGGLAKGTSALAKTSKIGSRINKALKAGQEFSQFAENSTAAVFSRYMENTMESSDTFNKAYQEALEKGASVPQAKLAAGQAARKNFWDNSALLFTDVLQFNTMFRSYDVANAAVNAAKRSGGLGLNLAWQGATEGGEEIYQYISSEESTRGALIKNRIKKDDGSSFEERLLNYAKDGNLWTSGFFGALGGVAFGATELHRQQQERSKQKERTQVLEPILKQQTGAVLSNHNIFKEGANQAFVETALQYAKNGMISKLSDNITEWGEGLKKATDEELSNLGIQRDQIDDIVKSRIEDTKAAQDLFNSIEKSNDSQDIKTVKFAAAMHKRFSQQSSQEANTNAEGILNEIAKDNGLSPEETELKRTRVLRDIAIENENKELASQLEEKMKSLTEQLKATNPNFNKEELEKKMLHPKTDVLKEQLSDATYHAENSAKAKDLIDKTETKDGKEEIQNTIDGAKKEQAEKELEHLKNSINSNTPLRNINDIQNTAKKLGKEQEINDLVKKVTEDAESNAQAFDPANIQKSLEARYNGNQLLADIEFKELAKKLGVPGLDEETIDQLYRSNPRAKETIGKFYEEKNGKIREISSGLVAHTPESSNLESEIGDPYYDTDYSVRPFFTIGHQFTIQKIGDGKWRTVYGNDKNPTPTKRDDSGIDWNTVNDPTFASKLGTPVYYEIDPSSEYNKKDSNPHTREILTVVYKDGNPENKSTSNRVVIGTVRAWYENRPFNDVEAGNRLKSLREVLDRMLDKANPGVQNFGIYSKVVQKLPGRPWGTGQNSAPHEVLAENEPLIFGIGREVNGKTILDVPNVDNSLLSYNRDLIKSGAAYQIVRAANGKLVPIRLFTKTLSSDPQALSNVLSILREMNPDNFKSLKKELDEIVFIPGKDLTFSNDGVRYKGETPNEENIGSLIRQINVKKINRGDYNQTISKQGILATNIHPGIHFHSAKFELSQVTYSSNVRQSSPSTTQNVPTEGTISTTINTTAGQTNVSPLTKLVLGKPKFSLQSATYKLWERDTELKWFKKNFPSVPIEVLDNLNEIYKHGANRAWGMFYNAAVYIHKEANAGTTYHEAFHVAFNLFLNDAVRNSIYTEASVKYGIDLNDREAIEEKLANEFADYVQQQHIDESVPGKIKTFFKNLWQFIKSLFTDNVNIDELFYRASNRHFANKQFVVKNNSAFGKAVPKFKLHIDPNIKEARVRLLNTLFFQELEEVKSKVYNNPQMSDVEAINKRGLHNIYAAVHNILLDAIESKDFTEYQREQLKEVANNFVTGLNGGTIASVGDYYISAVRNLSNFGIDVKLKRDFVKLNETEPENKAGEVDEDNNNYEGWETKIVSVSGKETLSYEIKKMLRQVPAGKIIDKVVQTGKDDIEFVKFVNFDITYNYLERNLADTYSESEMMDKLDSLVAYRPELEFVLDKLRADDKLRTQFFVNFAKTHTRYINIKQFINPDPFWNPEISDRPELLTSWRVFSSNRQGVRELILNEWRNNYKDTSRNFYLKEGQIDTEFTKKLYEEFNSLLTRIRAKYDVTEKDADDLSSILYRAGIDMTGKELLSEYTQKYERLHGTLFEVSPFDAFNSLLSGANASIDIILGKLAEGKNPFEGNDFEFNSLNKLIGIKSRFNEDIIQSAFQNVEGKNIYSHQNPSYLSKSIQRLKKIENIDWFKKDAYYHNNPWLKELADNKESRDKLEYVYLDGMAYNNQPDGTRYNKLSDKNFEVAALNAYYNNGQTYGYLKVPTLSDSPTMAFIKFKKFSKEEVISALIDVAKAEQATYGKYILLQGLNEKVDLNSKEASIAVRNWLDNEFKNEVERLKDITVLDKDGKLNRNVSHKAETDFLSNYFYNSVLANTQIYQLFIGDVSKYKTSDLYAGKRNNEITKPGVKLNTNVIREVFRSIYLEDVMVNSRTGEFGKAVENIMKNLNYSPKDIDRILSQYTAVNTTDAQSFITLDRYREIMTGLGRWTNKHENAYNALKKGATPKDIDIILQPIKPFYYGLHYIESLNRILPIQNKNSEAVLLPHFAYAKNEDGSYKYPTLAGTLKYMEDNNIDSVQFTSAVKVGNYGSVPVDNILGKKGEPFKWARTAENSYEVSSQGDKRFSALNAKLKDGRTIEEAYQLDVKGYRTSPTDKDWRKGKGKPPKGNLTKEQSWEEYKKLWEQWAKENPELIEDLKNKSEGKTLTDKFATTDISQARALADILNKKYANSMKQPEVHELMNDNYVIQQEVPEHHLDDENIFGTQIRKLILANLSDKRKYLNGMSKDEIVKLYNDLIAANVKDSFNEVASRFDDLGKLSELIKEEIRDRKLGENYEAITDVVPNGEGGYKFKLPLFFPTQAKRVESLLSSIFRNKVTRQKINGGSFVLVSNFGLSDRLKIVFNQQTKSVDYMEVMLPWWSKDFFPKNENGEVDIDKIDKDLLDIIGYRIPTEGLYSIKRMKVVGFTPQEMGGVAILPNEITKISGEDFDIDKLFIMIPQYAVHGNRAVKVPYDLKKGVDNMTKMERDNALMDIIKSIWSSNNSFEDIITPGGYDNLKAIRDSFNLASSESGALALPHTQRSIFNKNMTGAGLIGIFANHNVSHAAFQHFSMKLRGGVKFDGKTLNTLYGEVDTKGNLISRNLASLVASSVDNSKDPILGDLNINSYTADILSMILRVGHSMETAIAFLNQPVVREYTKRLFNKGLSGRSEMIILNELKQEYKKQYKQGTNNDLKDSKFINDLKTENLKKNIGLPYNYALDITEQYRVLENLQRYKRYATKLTALVNATRADSTGSGKNMAENEIKLEAINEILSATKPLITGSAQPFNPDRPYKIINAFTSYGLEKPTEILSRFFPWSNYSFKQFKSNLQSVKGFPLTEKEITLANFSALTFHLSNFFDNGEKQSIIHDLGDRLQNYKKDNTGKYRIIDVLGTVLENNTSLKRIVFNNNFSMTEEQRDYIIDSWSYMLQNGTEDEKKLANDLIKYSFFTAGFNFNPNSFNHLIPPLYLAGLLNNGTTFTERLENVNGKDELNRDEIDRLTHQFVRNNYLKENLVPAVDYNRDSISGYKYNKDYVPTSIRIDAKTVKDARFVREEGEDFTTFAPYIRMEHEGQNYLYQYIGNEDDTVGVYQVIPPLGISYFIEEYNRDQAELESVIKDNKINDIVTFTTKQSVEDMRLLLDQNYDDILKTLLELGVVQPEERETITNSQLLDLFMKYCK